MNLSTHCIFTQPEERADYLHTLPCMQHLYITIYKLSILYAPVYTGKKHGNIEDMSLKTKTLI